MRTYNAAAKFIESIADDFTNDYGIARGTLNDERYSLKVQMNVDGRTVTAILFDYKTRKITKVPNAKTADVRNLAKTATGTWQD